MREARISSANTHEHKRKKKLKKKSDGVEKTKHRPPWYKINEA
jgi:hypothetical protein